MFGLTNFPHCCIIISFIVHQDHSQHLYALREMLQLSFHFNFIFSLVYALVCVNRGRNMKGSLMNDDTNSCNISMRVRLSEIKHFGSSSIQSQWVAYKLDRKSSLLMLRENSFLTSLYSQRLHIFLTTTGRTSAACWDWREKVFGVCRLI